MATWKHFTAMAGWISLAAFAPAFAHGGDLPICPLPADASAGEQATAANESLAVSASSSDQSVIWGARQREAATPSTPASAAVPKIIAVSEPTPLITQVSGVATRSSDELLTQQPPKAPALPLSVPAPGVSEAVLAQLELLVQPLAPQPVEMEVNALPELNEILSEGVPWVLTREPLLDLNPGAPEPASTPPQYLVDLYALVEEVSPAAQQRAEGNRQMAQVARIAKLPPGRAFLYPPAPPPTAERAPHQNVSISTLTRTDCESYGDVPVAGGADALFRPINTLQLSGMSSDPPAYLQTALDDQKLPTDDACQYMQTSAPSFYYPSPRFGFRRAPRNPARFCHNPLYFEDPNLERCGESYGCFTNAHSTILFSARLFFLPYLVASNCPRSCVPALPDCPTCHSLDRKSVV